MLVMSRREDKQYQEEMRKRREKLERERQSRNKSMRLTKKKGKNR